MAISDLIFFENNNTEYANFIRNHVISNNQKGYNITEKIQLAAIEWKRKNKKRKFEDLLN